MLKVRHFNSVNLPKPRLYEDFQLPAGPLDIEIGCGTGIHSIRYAKRHPERHLVAIEHTRTRYSKFSNRLKQQDLLPNLMPVHANAISWVSYFLKPESVDRYFILYPNPYPKKNHLNRRWHAMPFMEQIVNTLKLGGTICLATNLESYIEEARQYFQEVWDLEEVSFIQVAGDPILGRTAFECKFLGEGVICYDLIVRKRGPV